MLGCLRLLPCRQEDNLNPNYKTLLGMIKLIHLSDDYPENKTVRPDQHIDQLTTVGMPTMIARIACKTNACSFDWLP